MILNHLATASSFEMIDWRCLVSQGKAPSMAFLQTEINTMHFEVRLFLFVVFCCNTFFFLLSAHLTPLPLWLSRYPQQQCIKSSWMRGGNSGGKTLIAGAYLKHQHSAASLQLWTPDFHPYDSHRSCLQRLSPGWFTGRYPSVMSVPEKVANG